MDWILSEEERTHTAVADDLQPNSDLKVPEKGCTSHDINLSH